MNLNLSFTLNSLCGLHCWVVDDDLGVQFLVREVFSPFLVLFVSYVRK